MKVYRLNCNWSILFLALTFGLMQTAHFGWNVTPTSDAEVICDGITLLIGALAFLKQAKGE